MCKGDDILVRSFELLPDDNTAATKATSRISPQNGSVASLIKVVSNQKGYNFDGGVFDIVGDVVYRDGEIWVYVPSRAQKISISHYKYGSLKDYYFPIPLEEGRTYRMVIDPQIGVFTDISADHAGSTIYLDGDSIGISPMQDYYMLYGKHRLTADSDSHEGSIDITIANTGDTDKRDILIPMIDKSLSYGDVLFAADDEVEVYLNGSKLGQGSFATKLKEGKYTVESRRKGYDPAITTFNVTKQQQNYVTLNAPVQQNAVLIVYGWPEGINVSIDGKKQKTERPITQNTPFVTKLQPGLHELKFSKEYYRTQKDIYDFTPGEEKKIFAELDFIDIVPSTSVYFGTALSLPAQFRSMQTKAILGATKKNFNVELGAAFPIDKYDINKYSVQGSSEKVGDVSVSCYSAKVGYRWVSFMPQIGVNYCNFKYKGKKDGWDASCFYATIGYRFGLSWGHFSAFADIEYDFMPFGKSGAYDDFLPFATETKTTNNIYYYEGQLTIKDSFLTAGIGFLIIL